MRFMMLPLCLLTAAAWAARQEKSDRELLQGTWTVVSADTGIAEIDRHFEGGTVRINGDTLTFHNREGEPREVVTFRLDAKKTPKHIDLTSAKDKATLYGIYAIENGKLRMCWSAKEGGGRPLDFTVSGTPSKFRIMVFERQKK